MIKELYVLHNHILTRTSPSSQTFIFQFLLSILLLGSSEAARQLRGNIEQRGERSLVNTFPFNSNAAADDHHHGHHEDHAASPRRAFNNVPARSERQGSEGPDVSFGAVAAAGQRCIDKVEMVEETEYDDVVQCDHSYDKRCHTTYVTNYESQQEEECEENFRKYCFIEYEQIA